MCSQGFNRYPNDILKLSFSYAWGVISIWKWYLWKGMLGSPKKSEILPLLHCSSPHDIWEMMICVSLWEYTHTHTHAPVSTLVLKRPEEGIRHPSLPLPAYSWGGISPWNLELLSSWLVWMPASSSGPPMVSPGSQGYGCVQGALLVMWVLTFRLWSSLLFINHS